MDWNNKAKWLLGSRTAHIEGDGQFAVVTPCGKRAFSLWDTRADAERVMNGIESCGSNCLGVASHYIVDLGGRTAGPYWPAREGADRSSRT